MNELAKSKSDVKDTAPIDLNKDSIKDIKVEPKEVKLSFPREFSHIVYLRRKPTGGALPVEGDFADESIVKIGSGFKDKGVLRGLNFKEEIRWLSSMLGVSPESDNWEKATKSYWENISKEVPPSDKKGEGGLKLEVGLKYKNIEDYEHDQRTIKTWGVTEVGGSKQFIALENPKGEPIDLGDYILWRYCLVYSKVSNSFEEVGKSAKIDFYLFSREKEIKDKKVSFEQKKKATQLLYQNLHDRIWINRILTLFIQADKQSTRSIRDIEAIEEDEKDVIIADYLNTNPSLFLAWGTDKHLETRSEIERWISLGLLIRIPNTNSISFEGNTIGNTMEETITFLNNEKNSFILGQLKAQANTRP